MEIAGVAMTIMMWAAEWPLACHTFSGALTGSTSPFADYHLIDAMVMVMVALVPVPAALGASPIAGVSDHSSGDTRR